MFELPDRAPIPTLSRYKPQPKLKVYRPSVPELLQTHPTPRAVSERNETRVSRLWSLAQVHDRLFGRMGMGVGLRTHMPRRSEGASKCVGKRDPWAAPRDELLASRHSRQFIGWLWQVHRWKADVTRFQPVQVRPQTDHPLASAGGRKAP